MGGMPIVPGAQEPNAHRVPAHPFCRPHRQASPPTRRRVDATAPERGNLRPAVWGDTLSWRSFDAETSRRLARQHDDRAGGMRDSGVAIAVDTGLGAASLS